MLSLKPQLSLSKNQLFIAHDEERKKIAATGHEYVLTNYATENFW